MRVDEIGDHICCVVPGGRSLVTVGMPGVTNTSQFKSRSSLMFAHLNSVSSLLPLFSRDPLQDMGWAMEEFSSILLTHAQEAEHLQIHQRHFLRNPTRSCVRCPSFVLSLPQRLLGQIPFHPLVGAPHVPAMEAGSERRALSHHKRVGARGVLRVFLPERSGGQRFLPALAPPDKPSPTFRQNIPHKLDKPPDSP